MNGGQRRWHCTGRGLINHQTAKTAASSIHPNTCHIAAHQPANLDTTPISCHYTKLFVGLKRCAESSVRYTLQHQLIWQQKWGDQQKLTNSKSEARHWSWWWHDCSSGVITISVKYSIFLAMALRTRVTITALRCWKYDIYSNLLTI